MRFMVEVHQGGDQGIVQNVHEIHCQRQDSLIAQHVVVAVVCSFSPAKSVTMSDSLTPLVKQAHTRVQSDNKDSIFNATMHWSSHQTTRPHEKRRN